MKNKQVCALVIDASVAMAAGVSAHPTSRRCREFLDVLRTGSNDDCKCVFSPALRAEWNNHASLVSVRWLSAMTARKRVIRHFPAADPARSNLCADRLAGDDAPRRDKIAAALDKDEHLIQASIAHGRRIVSLDETCRGYFHDCAPYRAELKTIVWVNPDKPEETCLDWLASGAPLEKHRMLGYQP